MSKLNDKLLTASSLQ